MPGRDQPDPLRVMRPAQPTQAAGRREPPVTGARRVATSRSGLTATRPSGSGRSGSGGGSSGGGSGGGLGGGSGGGRGTGGPAPRPSRGAARRARRAAQPLWQRVLLSPVRLIWGLLKLGMVLGLTAAAALFALVVIKAQSLPPVESLVDGRARGSVTLIDRDGAAFAWRGDQYAGMITVDQVSPHLRNAIVATEDRRFLLHPGVDPVGIAGAVRINLAEGRGPLEGNGGSTITQQTAKLLCLGRTYDPAQWASEAAYEEDCRAGTVKRKIDEALYAMAMEWAYSKDEILTLYLNRAYLGAGTRGFEAAAQRYFGISARDVNPAQAAMLAGLLKAPSTFAPTSNLERSQGRAAIVLGLMEEQGYLTADEAAEARANPARVTGTAATVVGGAFADWVMDQGPDFFTSGTTEDVTIRTTFDPRIQAAAEEALAEVFATQVRAGSEAQAAIVVMSADGAVRAMVGGRGTPRPGDFNRATMALRQTGSAFKPFVYAAALDLGLKPTDLVEDVPVCMDIAGSGQWCPENYDRTFKGTITLTQALAESRNIPAVLLSEQVGREAVRNVAGQFGLQGDLALGPALALGASESTLVQMTGAYAGILNGGSAVAPYGLVDLTIDGDATPVMDAQGGIRERVIQENAAHQLTWMMWRVVEDGTGQRARIPGWEIAGKTGTTQAARDAWFVGFSGDTVTGVWMGYDDNTPLTGVTGGGLPADIWHQVMVRVLDGQAPVPLPMTPPEQVVAGWVDPSGMAADGSGQAYASSGDPALDAALAEIFGPAQGQGTQGSGVPVTADPQALDPGVAAPAPQPAPQTTPQPNGVDATLDSLLQEMFGPPSQ